MDFRNLKISELLTFEGNSEAEAEVFRRLSTVKIAEPGLLEEARDEGFEEGYDAALPEAIEFIYRLMDGELWTENLDTETRDWIKTDLLMLLPEYRA